MANVKKLENVLIEKGKERESYLKFLIELIDSLGRSTYRTYNFVSVI